MIDKRDQGFSLLEVLIALGIMSGCVLLLSFGISQIGTTRENIRDDRQIDWHLFINQFAFELSESENPKVSKEKISFEILDVTDQQVKNVTYERYYTLIRRQVGSKGHQPLLLDVETIHFSLKDQILDLKVTFLNGETYQAKFRIRDQVETKE